jgi:hypothetical protein
MRVYVQARNELVRTFMPAPRDCLDRSAVRPGIMNVLVSATTTWNFNVSGTFIGIEKARTAVA